MNGFKHFLLLLLLGPAAPSAALAHSEFLDVHIISFAAAESPDRYTLVFDAETTDYDGLTNLPRKKRRFTVRLRCEPRFCAIKDYRAAVQLLRQRIDQSPNITISRMSSKGWRPVRGSRGVFESVGLYISKGPDDSKGPPMPMFVHDDAM